MTICLCGHSYRDHFQGGACPCGCLIFEPDPFREEAARLIRKAIQKPMELPDPPCEFCHVWPCECGERRDLR